MKQFDFSDWQKQVSYEIEQAGGKVDRLLLALRKLTDQTELILTESKEIDFSMIDCRAGCKSCCVMNVSVLFPEGLAIAEYVQTFPVAEKNLISERLEELWRAVRGLTDDERIGSHQSCAFLDDTGSCRIYPVRPLLCRSITSTSAESCRDALTENLFEEERPVMMNLFQREMFESVYLGVGEGLEKAELDGRGVSLTGLVRHLLKKPAAGAEWLSGKQLDWHDLA